MALLALCLPPAGSARFGGLERALFWTWMLERACKVRPRSPSRILHDLMNTGLVKAFRVRMLRRRRTDRRDYGLTHY
jgi:hypothetical protein